MSNAVFFLFESGLVKFTMTEFVVNIQCTYKN